LKGLNCFIRRKLDFDDVSGALSIIRQSLAMLSVALALSACTVFGDENSLYLAGSNLDTQPYPTNYRADLLAFMRAYLNEPQSVRDAVVAEPVRRSVAGKDRYIACLRYTATGEGDVAGSDRDHAAVFLDGRLERMVEKAKELCVGVEYTPFPELEKLKR
jgi:hypothetical protein